MSEKETNRVCYFLVHKNLSECLFICGVIRLAEHAFFMWEGGLPSCRDFSSSNQELGKPAGCLLNITKIL